ncbi:MAG: VIT1/CCC1 transporter family protein [Promethearchaeota archaeon]
MKRFKDGAPAAEPHKTGGELVKQLIFGANDDLVSTFALLAGLAGAALGPRVVLLTLLAEMFSGAVSMCLGEFISTKSRNEYFTNEIRKERAEMKLTPEVEREELRDIYRSYGFDGELLEAVVEKISTNEEVWLKAMLREELGIADVDLENPAKTALVMFFAFLLGALVPIAPYFRPVACSFAIAAVASFGGLFFVGVARTFVTGRPKLRSGLEMLFVGAVAFASTYGVGLLIGA